MTGTRHNEKAGNFGLRLNPEDRALLLRMAQKEDRSGASILRRLIRAEASRAGLVTGSEGSEARVSNSTG